MRRTKKTVLVTAIAAVAVFAATVFIYRAKAQTVINPGYDQFATPSSGTTQSLTLAFGALHNAAGSPSEPLVNVPVTFEGGANVQGYNADTVIERTQSVTVPGSTPLLVIGINMVSVGTIPVTFADNSSANYSIGVAQSSTQSSTGNMTFNSDGSFTNNLNVNIQYTFTAAGEPTTVINADTIAFNSTGTWQASGGSGSVAIRREFDDANAIHRGPAGAVGTTGGISVTVQPNTETSLTASHVVKQPCKKVVGTEAGAALASPCLNSPQLPVSQ